MKGFQCKIQVLYMVEKKRKKTQRSLFTTMKAIYDQTQQKPKYALSI